MKEWLVIAFIFFIGSSAGWVLEVLFRRFFSSANPTRRWINPGFLVGPCLPLYGFSLTVVYLLSGIDLSFIHDNRLRTGTLFVVMALCVTLIEYIAGLIFIKGMHIKLWDYTNEKFNIQGIICLKFTFFWYLLSALYYFVIHPQIIDSIRWLAGHLTFSFFVGMYYGFLIIDFSYSMNVMSKVKAFADENNVVVHYENFRTHIAEMRKERKEKARFLFSMKLETFSPRETFEHYLNHIRQLRK